MDISTKLPFPIECKGRTLITFEDASIFVLNLSDEARRLVHWQAAYAAFSCASIEPAYNKTALAALEKALTLEVLVDPDLKRWDKR